MKKNYDTSERKAIKQLTPRASALFDVIEREEKGEIADIVELCEALEVGPRFIAFSCLSGVGKSMELGQDLGPLFTTRLGQRIESFMYSLRNAGYNGELTVIVDDDEPVEVWGWSMSQKDVTTWYKMVIETTTVPTGWLVELWSDIQARDRATDAVHKVRNYLMNINGAPRALGPLLDHMRNFPNKKLRGDIRTAAARRLFHSALQGLVLERVLTQSILVQTETPWRVKDSLLDPTERCRGFIAKDPSDCLRKYPLPVIHPFEERR